MKKNSFKWSVVSIESFNKFKEVMSFAPLLSMLNFNAEFTVVTYTCEEGIVVVLMQFGKPITYVTKALSDRHKLLSIYEKEMLAIVMAIQIWRVYLVRIHFMIKINHHRIKFLLQQRITTPSSQNWLAKLLGYYFEVLYKRGSENIEADALSRKPTFSAISIVKFEIWERI